MKIDGGLALTAVATGLAMIPLFGFLPLLGIAAAVVTSIYIADNIRPK